MKAALDQRITWAVAYMQTNMAASLNIPALARRVNLAPSRFRQLFVAQTGVSPVAYLRAIRLRRARLLLERTFLTVKEVMALVGYNDPSHFARDFKRCYGAPPSSLRCGDDQTLRLAKSPTHRRIVQPRARDPGALCA
jgi:AraC family transcriptional regulator, arabinose operon regulatory protein